MVSARLTAEPRSRVVGGASAHGTVLVGKDGAADLGYGRNLLEKSSAELQSTNAIESYFKEQLAPEIRNRERALIQLNDLNRGDVRGLFNFLMKSGTTFEVSVQRTPC